MKKSLLIILIAFTLFLSCSQPESPLIGVTMVYWEGKYSIDKYYMNAIRENGGQVRLIPCTDDAAFLQDEIRELDGFVFIGGRDYPPEWYGKDMHSTMVVMDPHRARFDSLFMDLALKSKKPILGVCAGEQLLAVATGGKLIRDVPDHRGVQHMIYSQKESMISELYGDSIKVNSWHHQCIDPDFLNDSFQVTAWSADSIVECIEWQGDQWILGTQFHPERLPKTQRDKIIGAFLNECR